MPHLQRNATWRSFTQDEFEASFDLVECNECDAPFNLGAQPYYNGRCPSCQDEE